MLEFFLNLDNAISGFLADIIPHGGFFDYIFLFLSFYGLTLLVWGVLLIIFLLFEIKNHKKLVLYFILSFATTYLLVHVIIKTTVQRQRPYVVRKIDTVFCPKDYSFPSGHASSAFAGAVMFGYFDKKRKWWYYSLAFLISYSRIYLYCHYFFDVFFGAYIGYIISKFYIVYLSDSNEKDHVQPL